MKTKMMKYVLCVALEKITLKKERYGTYCLNWIYVTSWKSVMILFALLVHVRRE